MLARASACKQELQHVLHSAAIPSPSTLIPTLNPYSLQGYKKLGFSRNEANNATIYREWAPAAQASRGLLRQGFEKVAGSAPNWHLRRCG